MRDVCGSERDLLRRLPGNFASHPPQPAEDVGGEHGNARTGNDPSHGPFRSWFSVGELVAADHNRDQAHHLGDCAGEEGLQASKAGIELRTALGERNGGECNRNEGDCGSRLVDTAESRAVLAETLDIGSSVLDFPLSFRPHAFGGAITLSARPSTMKLLCRVTH